MMRHRTVQLDRQKDPLMEEDKGEERTIPSGDSSTQPATSMHPHACLRLTRYSLLKIAAG